MNTNMMPIFCLNTGSTCQHFVQRNRATRYESSSKIPLSLFFRPNRCPIVTKTLSKTDYPRRGFYIRYIRRTPAAIDQLRKTNRGYSCCQNTHIYNPLNSNHIRKTLWKEFILATDLEKFVDLPPRGYLA